jgi:hypothetical protein
VDAAIVRLALTADATLAPYENVLAWETKVDGKPWAAAKANLAASQTVHGVLSLFTACDSAGTDGRDDGLTPGPHDVELKPTLVGSTASIEPAKLKVTVSCDASNGTTPKTIGEQEDPPTQTTAEDPGTTPPSGTATNPEPATAPAASSCAAAPTTTGASSLASIVGVALALIAVRRRTR